MDDSTPTCIWAEQIGVSGLLKNGHEVDRSVLMSLVEVRGRNNDKQDLNIVYVYLK